MARDGMLAFEVVWPTIAAQVTPLPGADLPLDGAAGRWLLRPAVAAWDLPRFDAAAMDGFAVRAADCTGAGPFRLALAPGDAYAAPGEPGALPPGHALPIGTGGVLPDGADAIAIREVTRVEEGAVVVERPVEPGAHVRRRGEELRAGDVVLEAGVRLGPRALAAAAAAGVRKVSAGTWPRVAIVSTGSELVEPEATPGAGQIVDTNRPFLERSVACATGAPPALSLHVGDDREAVETALREALGSAEVLVVTGGVSVGDRDYVRGVLEQALGAEPLFWRVAQKPGKPLYVARAGARWIVGLPGNPAAVIVHFNVVVAPLLRALAGAPEPAPRRLPVRIAAPLHRDRRRTLLRWATLHAEDGALRARPLARSGSHMISDLARADVLVIVPPGDGAFAPGDTLEAISLER